MYGIPSEWSVELKPCQIYSGAQKPLSICFFFYCNLCLKFLFGIEYGPVIQDNVLSLSQHSCHSNMTLQRNNHKNIKKNDVL